jgi:hypothetical protein
LDNEFVANKIKFKKIYLKFIDFSRIKNGPRKIWSHKMRASPKINSVLATEGKVRLRLGFSEFLGCG